MEIKKISVSFGRTFSHPCEQYSNFRISATVDAEATGIEVVDNLLDDVQEIIERKEKAIIEAIERVVCQPSIVEPF